MKSDFEILQKMIASSTLAPHETLELQIQLAQRNDLSQIIYEQKLGKLVVLQQRPMIYQKEKRTRKR